MERPYRPAFRGETNLDNYRHLDIQTQYQYALTQLSLRQCHFV